MMHLHVYNKKNRRTRKFMTENVPVIKSMMPAEIEFTVMQTVARNAAASGLYTGVGSEQKILMILLAARELGIAPMAALNGGLWNIQGKIEISARMINSMLRKAGIKITIVKSDAKGCILEGLRPDNGDTCTVKFLEEDAVRLGVLSRDNWKKNPEDMYFARAISKLGRRLAPDILGTAYVEGEIRDAKCEVIEASVQNKEAENVEEREQRLLEFVKDYPQEDHELMKTYLQKYASHYNKTMTETISDYSKKEKFIADFLKWKLKLETTSQQQAA